MKVKLINRFFLAAIFFAVTSSISAQIYVRARPVFPVIVRPPQPSPVHVWINEEWEPSENSYRFTGSHWESPSQRGYYRTNGHWQNNKHGLRWVPGSWQERRNRGKSWKH